MNRRLRLLLVMMALLGFSWASSLAGAASDARTGARHGNSILFEDDFNGPARALPAASKWGDWSRCAYNRTASVGKIRCGADETLDGAGHLSIPARPTYGTAISTAGKFGFKYGTASAWIKMPSQVGYWPAFWMLNNEPNGRDAQPVGEIDAMEGYTTWPNSYHVTVHNWNGARTWHGPDEQCARGINLSRAFHKYSAKVEPGKITFFFDDKRCGTAVTPAMGGRKPWAFGRNVTRPNWLLLDLAVGGAGGRQARATRPAVMLVDRVEVRRN